MKMSFYKVQLPLQHPFTISRSTRTNQPSLFVALEHDGVTGFGEVTENTYYGRTFSSMISSLEKARPHLERYLDDDPTNVWNGMQAIVESDMFALSALDIAAHDLRGKQKGIPTWQDWGLDWTDVVLSSYTIGIDSIEKMIEKMNEQPNWPVYKIKLGSDNDLEVVRQLRKHTNAIFRVDANCGWTADQAIANSRQLAEMNVEFIEQPLSVDTRLAEKRKLFEQSALPIIADEDCQVAADIANCGSHFHGVNIKISKCGGLTPALAMLRQAKQLGLKAMVGCMVESSIGISGAAQLLPLLDYADLDGANLLRAEPATGIKIINGRIPKPVASGCGTSIDFENIHHFETANP